MEIAEAVFNNSLMQVVLILVVIDAAVGIITSASKNQLKPAKLAYFLHDSFLPYVVVFAVVELIGLTVVAWSWLVSVVFILIVVGVASNIVGNLAKLGMPCPPILKKD